MGDKRLKLLLVEDDADDVILLHEALREIEETRYTGSWQRSFHVTHAGRLSDALNLLRAVAFDVVLLELFLPDSAAFHTFLKIRAVAPDVPIVVLSSLDDENLAARLLREGAQDYLLKGDLDPALLARSLRYAIERQRLVRSRSGIPALDELTGLYNRAGFLHLAAHLLRLGQRCGKRAVLALATVDGLECGPGSTAADEIDTVLIDAAEQLREALPQADLLARLDAHRFAALAVETSRAGLEAPLHLLDGGIRRLPAALARNPLTLAVGVAESAPGGADSLDDLLRSAEQALCENRRVEHRSGCHV